MSGADRQRRIATVTLVVAAYDEAVAWFTDKLGFELLDDSRAVRNDRAGADQRLHAAA